MARVFLLLTSCGFIADPPGTIEYVRSGEEEFRHYSISYSWDIINESDKTKEGLQYLTIELVNADSMTIGERRVMDGGRFIEYGTHEWKGVAANEILTFI